MKSNRLKAIALVLAVLLPMAACSKDPDVAKRDYVARADRYVKQNKLPEAVIEYQNAIKLDARYGEARFKLGDVYERQGDIAKAYREFVRAATSFRVGTTSSSRPGDTCWRPGGSTTRSAWRKRW